MTSRIDLLPNLARVLNKRRTRLMIALASLALFWACYPTRRHHLLQPAGVRDRSMAG